MKLKQLPEDFKVEELNELEISRDEKPYKVYLLEKKSMETFSLLSYLAKKNNIPVSELGIAGLKDKHAITKQHFTLPSKYDLKTLQEKNFRITFLGYVSEKLKLGSLTGNRFEITVRDVKKGELEGVAQKADSIEKTGVPNYFDSQRFGSVINQEFVAKYLIKKDYEKAVKVYLTLYTKFESSKVKEEKKLILQNWGSFSKLRLKNPSLKRVTEEYEKTKDWLKAYKKIPPNIREMMISAYQSYLWNECVKKVLKLKINNRKIYPVRYSLGALLFYKNVKEINDVPETFKTISQDMEITSFEREVITEILSKEMVSIKSFDIKET
ncbi:MAG: tRNA pseudouridine(13) synthase TruD, partial [Nanoarchaeota archaeon]|nr:tRNA pseudouridine(13) synthase TruD [Nanoarchaeota archaeon]